MVFNRINFIRLFTVCVLTVLFSILLAIENNPTETSPVKAILPYEIINNTKIVPVIEHSASTIKVVFESDNKSDTEELKQNFLHSINKDVFTTVSANFTEILDWYSKKPENFVSQSTIDLLKSKNYDTVYQQGLERLYNPTGFSVVSIDRDPFILLTDFLLSNDTIRKNNNIDGKYYDTEMLQLNCNNENLNKSIRELIKTKNKYSKGKNRIYLAGTPIHTYYTALTSAVSINIICFLITLLIIFLTYFYFKNFKILLPILLSISFGLLAGYSVTKYLFSNFHLITFLFGTSLIGIGVDYSYHYIFKETSDTQFFKNLTLSFLSTIAAFAALYLTQTDILNQISTFTIVGLTAIYLFIIILYPIIKFPIPQRIHNPKISNKIKLALIIFASVVIILGGIKIKFNDDLSALYTPNKLLQKSETLFSKISNQEIGKNYIIAVKRNSLQALLETEEEITSDLNKENINYLCVSKFIPSAKKQKENSFLVKELYNNKLDKYRDILTESQIALLKQISPQALSLNIDDYPFFKTLFLDNKTSMIIAFSEKIPQINSNDVEIINIQNTLSEYLKQHRLNLEKLLPAIYILLYLILLAAYGFKKSLKMFLPILISQIFVISFMSLIGIKQNMFSLLGLILSLGFTIDYTIFSCSKSERANTAIFLACITTALSFFLLVFTTFKLISILSLTTSLCIISSYVLTKIFIQGK